MEIFIVSGVDIDELIKLGETELISVTSDFRNVGIEQWTGYRDRHRVIL